MLPLNQVGTEVVRHLGSEVVRHTGPEIVRHTGSKNVRQVGCEVVIHTFGGPNWKLINNAYQLQYL